MNLPYKKAPCKHCPFRKDTLKNWLRYRIVEILKQKSFICHKTIGEDAQQCAGHMILKGDDNIFVKTANRYNVVLELNNQDIVFDSEADCIAHHGGGLE